MADDDPEMQVRFAEALRRSKEEQEMDPGSWSLTAASSGSGSSAAAPGSGSASRSAPAQQGAPAKKGRWADAEEEGDKPSTDCPWTGAGVAAGQAAEAASAAATGAPVSAQGAAERDPSFPEMEGEYELQVALARGRAERRGRPPQSPRGPVLDITVPAREVASTVRGRDAQSEPPGPAAKAARTGGPDRAASENFLAVRPALF
jgi:hypothetical protein